MEQVLWAHVALRGARSEESIGPQERAFRLSSSAMYNVAGGDKLRESTSEEESVFRRSISPSRSSFRLWQRPAGMIRAGGPSCSSQTQRLRVAHLMKLSTAVGGDSLASSKTPRCSHLGPAWRLDSTNSSSCRRRSRPCHGFFSSVFKPCFWLSVWSSLGTKGP